MFRPALLLFLCLVAAGCGSPQTPSARLALDGPPLHIAMQGDASHWSGHMDRGCMTGFGPISLQDDKGVTCRGQMDHPANDKGRLYAKLSCTNGSTVTLVFRNLGPDQGMGLGRVNPHTENDEQLAFFYHSSWDEALRRLQEVKADIAAARASKQR